MFLVTTFSMERKRFLAHIFWWVTNWAMALMAIVSLCVYTKFHLDRERRVLDLSMEFIVKISTKNRYLWRLLNISATSTWIKKRRISMYPVCAKVSASNCFFCRDSQQRCALPPGNRSSDSRLAQLVTPSGCPETRARVPYFCFGRFLSVLYPTLNPSSLSPNTWARTVL